MTKAGIYLEDGHQVEGATAEVVSVLFTQTAFPSIGNARLADVLAALDTRVPAEERVGLASTLVRKFAMSSILCRWLPPVSLPTRLEYANQFYPGYRDHTIHTLLAYLLGWYVFSRNETIRTGLINTLRSCSDDTMSDTAIFHEWWTATALWHDVGYPFEATSFVSDQNTRISILRELEAELHREPLLSAITQDGPISSESIRAIYRDARYYPLSLLSMETLFTDRVTESIDRLYWKLGADRDKRPSLALRDLTVEAPQGRPSYYDHGLTGALLLNLWWADVDGFSLEIGKVENVAIPRTLQTKLTTQPVLVDGLFRLAIESIAFHNYSLRQWPAAELRRLLIPGTQLAMPTLSDNPHLFFLSLIDTLQDWDRHHFIPLGEKTYRPAVPSSRMLLQATQDKLLVQIQGVSDAVRKVNSLFDGWLDEASCSSLFAAEPKYTIPSIVFAPDVVTVAAASHSQHTKETVIRELKRATTEVRPTLANGSNDLSVACGQLNSADTFASGKFVSMLPSDVQLLKDGTEWKTFIQLQKVIASLVTIGATIPRGQVTQKLGEGGFGTVFAVHGTQDLSPIAYKMFHPSDLENASKRHRFRRGYDAMQRIGRYAGVVQVYEYTEFPVGFSMQLVVGQNLHEQCGRLPDIHTRVKILEQVAETLSFAHSRDVLHRDVKPANVLIDQESGRPVLTDFDLAWISGRSTIAGPAYASMLYGAPEQFENKLSALREEPTVDVYSFGALAYFVLTRREPAAFYAITTDEIKISLQEALAGQILAGSIDSLSLLIAECLRREPRQRPQTIAAVLDRLRRVKLATVDDSANLRGSMFLREIETSTGFSFTEGKGVSMSGRVGVTVDVSETDETSTVMIRFTLLGLPSHNVVSHEEFRDAVARKLRSLLDRKYSKERTVEKHVSSGMNEWGVRLRRLRRTAQEAWRVGEIVRDGVSSID